MGKCVARSSSGRPPGRDDDTPLPALESRRSPTAAACVALADPRRVQRRSARRTPEAPGSALPTSGEEKETRWQAVAGMLLTSCLGAGALQWRGRRARPAVIPGPGADQLLDPQSAGRASRRATWTPLLAGGGAGEDLVGPAPAASSEKKRRTSCLGLRRQDSCCSRRRGQSAPAVGQPPVLKRRLELPSLVIRAGMQVGPPTITSGTPPVRPAPRGTSWRPSRPTKPDCASMTQLLPQKGHHREQETAVRRSPENRFCLPSARNWP